MFGRQRRRETQELLQAARERLDASAHQTAVLVNAISALNATIGADIERTQRLEETADATTRALHHALSAQATDVSDALEHVASMYALLAQRIETDRLERSTFTEAIRQLSRPTVLPEAARPRVLGGSVFATPAAGAREIARDDSVDLVAGAQFDPGVAVCCRFGDQWIDGVEIVEVLGNANKPVYRLRRRQDSYVLPALFGPGDLRLAARTTAEASNGDADAHGRWARS